MARTDLADLGDAALVFAVARYEQAALAEVFRRHGGAVHGLARRLLREDAAAEEVAQEVFLRLWRQPDRYDPDRGSLRSFLLAQAHGRAVDVIRSEESRRRREERDARRAVDAGYDLEREVWDLEVSERLGGALGELPEEQRSAIVLAYFGGYTYREVAGILGAPEGTVKSRIRSGLSQLRGALDALGIGAPT
ncbi:MAG: sigma-70 family RNA polymerase sigma factor [Acidimicrobiales bacterium]|nr:sigma-70 family RNA polymerase sigma factor [Acidimicrobiales bacterium]MCB9373294.1 sigma-70 family RNA polymerase sigma factor [Microthrixaceae bacterium]